MTQTALTTIEQSRLELLEQQIDEGLASFIKVGQALAEIDETKLYRNQHGTFEQYCEARWNISRSRGYQLIAASKMSTIVDIKHESWARPLAELPTVEDKQVAVYLAKNTAPDGKVTAQHLRSTVKVLKDIKASGTVDLADGSMTAIQAAIATETDERLKRQRQHQQDNSQWERLNGFEAPAKLAAEKLNVLLTETDQAEVIKVLIFKRKARTSGEGA